jgi:hypothetical protein
LPKEILLPDGKRMNFVASFKYLGSTITPLNEGTEINGRIKKAKSIMGASRYFFDNVDW